MPDSLELDWPPTVEELRNDLKQDDEALAFTDEDDERLKRVLAAAVTFVERARPRFNYAGDPESELPEPTADLHLGTLRLAGRWHTRRRSPDALVQMGQELGTSRIPSFDPDIERLLRIGRHGIPVVG